MTKLSLDSLFNLAANTALLSSYNGTKVGCVAINEDGELLGTAANSIGKHFSQKEHDAMDRATRVATSVHAEENLIASYHDLTNATVILTHVPCLSCIKKLETAGVKEIYYAENPEFEEKWLDDKLDLYNKVELWYKTSAVNRFLLSYNTPTNTLTQTLTATVGLTQTPTPTLTLTPTVTSTSTSTPTTTLTQTVTENQTLS